MVVSLMVLTLLSMLGTLFIMETKTETQIAGHEMRATQALYNAEAGYAEVLARMSDVADSSYIGEPVGTVTPGWGRYLVLQGGASVDDPDRGATWADGLDNDGDGLIDEAGEVYGEIPSKQSGTDDINYPWVSVRYKLDGANQAILFGDHDNDVTTAPIYNTASGFPVIVVTANGLQGTADRTIEVEAVKTPFEIIQTALYAESDDFTFNGTPWFISGADWDPVTEAPIVGNSEVPGITTTGDPNVIDGSLTVNQQNNVEGEGGTPSTDSATADMDLELMRDTYAPTADYVFPGNTNIANASYGGYDDYKVVHCTGDLHISGSVSGGGLLIVDGDLDVTGGFTWYGLVIILGDFRFAGGGSAVSLYGSLLAGGSGIQIVGGNVDVMYSSAALARLQALTPYQVFNWREL
jgi:hypothetical protein